MSSTAHLARVRIELEFVGILPVGNMQPDPEKEIARRFRMLDVSIPGFALESRDMKFRLAPADLPNLSDVSEQTIKPNNTD